MNYTITEDQIKSIAEGGGKKKIKEMFPNVFLKELEVGKWYLVDGNKCGNSGGKLLANYSGNIDNNYGFDFLGNWNEKIALYSEDLFVDTFPATDEEVEAALIAEAKRRGFVDGAKVKALDGDVFFVNTLEFWNRNNEFVEPSKRFYMSAFTGSCGVIFREGKWAEIIKEKKLSKSEAEELITTLKNDGFKYKIV